MISNLQETSQEQLLYQINLIYSKYFKVGNDRRLLFEQMDHGPKQLCPQLFSIHQNCLIVSFEAFQRYYEFLFKKLRNKKQQPIHVTLMSADIMLALNGENDRAWNTKKEYLLVKEKCFNETSKYQGQQLMDLQWQLGFNAAVCLKCKKSSSYYEFRLRLIEVQLQQAFSNKNQQSMSVQLIRILQRQVQLVSRVLARFFRNYFCWMYRIKLIKLITETILKQLPLNSSQILLQTVIQTQLQNIHKFISKYCNDHSAYSYLISFTHRYVLTKQQKDNLNFLKKQLQWIQDLKEYCKVAYQENTHYKNLLMYQQHVNTEITKLQKDVEQIERENFYNFVLNQ